MASMLAAAVAAALAVYVAVQAARDIRSPVPAYSAGEDVMTRNERRDGVYMCVCAILFSLFLAAFACYVALIPGAAEAMEAGSTSRLVALTVGGLAVTAFCAHETALLCRADSDSDLYRMREVPVTYAAFVWSALFLAYAVALA